MAALFTRILDKAGNKENVFTECFAASLEDDLRLATDFSQHICGENVDGIPISTSRIEVKTQQRFPRSCVDMLFLLNGKNCLAVENKLGSPEGVSPTGERQLWKYAKLAHDGHFSKLAFITDDYARISKKVLDSPSYLRPKGRNHFMWTDFYEMVARNAGEFRSHLSRELLDVFNDQNFDPPPENLPNLHATDPDERRKNREGFAKLWRLTRQGLADREWDEVHPGSVAELHVKNGRSKRIKRLWVEPLWRRGSLRVRLSPLRRGELSKRIADSLAAADFPYHDLVKVKVGMVRRVRGKEPVVEARTRLVATLGDAKGPTIEQKLADFVLAVLDRAERVRI